MDDEVSLKEKVMKVREKIENGEEVSLDDFKVACGEASTCVIHDGKFYLAICGVYNVQMCLFVTTESGNVMRAASFVFPPEDFDNIAKAAVNIAMFRRRRREMYNNNKTDETKDYIR